MEGIPPEVADALRPVLPSLAAEMIRAIGEEVPDYSRPLEGPFGQTLRDGVERALRRFVDSIEHPGGVDERDRRVYIELGRGEMRQGRTLNALLSAYRVGALLAWRRFVQAGVDAGLEPETLYRVGEAIFAYIDEISGESIEGYASEQSAAAGELERHRTRLVRLLSAEPPPAPDVLRAAGQRARWEPPATLAALVVANADAPRVAGRLGPDAVAAQMEPGGEESPLVPGTHVVAFVADPDGPGRRAVVEAAIGSRRGALGPTVAVGESARSAERARRALELALAGAIAADRLVIAEQHKGTLLLHADPDLGAELRAARLGPLDALRPAARARLRETLHAWLDRQGRIDETARALHVHPQTVRYRLAQLREAFGPALDHPEARFELALALRVGERDEPSQTP